MMCPRMMSRRLSSPVCTRFVDNLQGFHNSYSEEMQLYAKKFYRTLLPFIPFYR